MTKNDSFLNSFSSISENQAEYAILTNLFNACENMIFLLEIAELKKVKEHYNNIVEYIKQNYRNFDLKKFYLDINGDISFNVYNSASGSSFKKEELFNYAIDISKENNSYVLVRSQGALVLIYNGKFDSNFESISLEKKKLMEINNNKRDINDLELVFENFHSERKHKGCAYIKNNKVENSIAEQTLRNCLIDFLQKATKLHIITELCTSRTNDEESVDIGVINSNNEVAIIEVKYFVKRGLFIDENKTAYSKKRFKDGYEQLNRYCVDLNKDNYKLHSAFLYMFYAHTDPIDDIIKAANDYYSDFTKEKSCSIEFKRSYKKTICDNMIDITAAG